MWAATRSDKEPFKPSPMPAFYAEVASSFSSIAKDGGGEYIALEQDKALVKSLLELTFGTRWKIEMKQFLNELS
jgi:hypothetical protein